MSGPSSESGTPVSALIVDDDPDMCWVLKAILELSGYSATVAQSGREALGLAAPNAFSVAFIDARLPDMDGLELAAKLGHQHGIARIVIISGYYSENSQSIVAAVRAKRVYAFLAKPFQIETIEAALF